MRRGPHDRPAIEEREIPACLCGPDAERAQPPLCPICEVGLVLNGESYALFLLPERHGWVYALYALHCVYEKDVNAVNHTLITDNALLSALMEIVIYQGGKRRSA